MEQYREALSLDGEVGDGDLLRPLRLHRKVVEVVTELKWSVSLESLNQANESRLASLASLAAGVASQVGEAPEPELVRALVALSTDAWRIREPADWEAAQEYAKAAVAMAEQVTSPIDLSLALGALANVLDGRSMLTEHLEVCDRRLALANRPDCGDVRERIDALRSAGAARMYVGAYQEALPFLQEAEVLATNAHVVEQQANAIGLQAQCWFRLDGWDEVLAAEPKWRALEREHSRQRVGETCFFVALSASVHALRGEAEQAEQYAAEAYDYMVTVSGSADQWQRNQFY
jgi:hypothetical protein